MKRLEWKIKREEQFAKLADRRTALLASSIYNASGNVKRSVSPDDFLPGERQEEEEESPEQVAMNLRLFAMRHGAKMN